MRKFALAAALAVALALPASAQFIGPGIWKSVPSSGTPLSLSPTQSIFSNPTTLSSSHIIYTSQAIGTADPTRIVVWAFSGNVGAGGADHPAGVTIGGVTATSLVGTLIGAESCEIWYAAVPTGTTATVDINYTAKNPPNRLGGELYAIYGSATAPTSGTSTSNTAPTHTYNFASYVAIGTFTGGFALTGSTLTNLTSDNNNNVGPNVFQYTQGSTHAPVSGSLAFTDTWSGSATESCGSFGAWQP